RGKKAKRFIAAQKEIISLFLFLFSSTGSGGHPHPPPVRGGGVLGVARADSRACRRWLQPLSPIQNNSDLAQGLLPIRPSKVRRSEISGARRGTWHRNQNQLGSNLPSGWFLRWR